MKSAFPLRPTKNRPADSTPAKDPTKVGHGWWQSIGQVGTEEKALDQKSESLDFPGKQHSDCESNQSVQISTTIMY